MLEFVDTIGWIGTILMFGGSLLSIYKHKACWTLWIIGGFAIIYQSIVIFSWNILILQILYMPLNVWGFMQWRNDDGNDKN
jgi:hypothetical protein